MMALLAFLRVNWKPFALLAIAALAWWLLHRFGEERYAAGEAARDRYWHPLFLAAEKAAAEANAHTAAIESAQTAATANAEARHAETVAALNARAADADQRIHALSVRLAAQSGRRCEVPAVPGTAPERDAIAAERERADRFAERIGDIGRRCESDAATLAELQSWVREQSALR